MRVALAALAAVGAAVRVAPADACTAMAISADATTIKAAITAHTADCSDCDNRLALVPGRRHAAGTQHAVYGVGHQWPRQRSSRAYIYEDMPEVAPVAYIDEAERTLGLYETMYALMNEEGLTLGESSCSSKIPAPGLDMPHANGTMGTAYFSIAALMRLALERCATAVCAIETMGALAEARGFYGESLMGGEALTLADTTGDAWVFHIMQDFSSNSSAIWAAQRVPAGHVAVIANEFTIQEIPQTPHRDFMFSANLFSEARAAGFWNGSGAFDFQQVYGTTTVIGENLYATMRLQWIYSRVAPSLSLPLHKVPARYNFSYPVERALSVEAAIDLLRGHYDGTEWDLTKGILAGPFGNPKRVEGGEGMKKVKGAAPRPISLPRTSHTHVGVARRGRPVMFFAPDEPASSVFAPFLAETLKLAAQVDLEETAELYAVPYAVSRRDQFQYRKSMFWALTGVANQLNLYYANMTALFVKPAMDKWQPAMMQALAQAPRDDVRAATAIARKAQEELADAWWDLYDALIVSYNDGTLNTYLLPNHDPKKPYTTFGYPAEWLRDIGFDNDFWKVQTFQGQITKACNKSSDSVVLQQQQQQQQHPAATATSLFALLPTLCVGLLLGAFLRGRGERATVQSVSPEPLLPTSQSCTI
jgi:dipeptidase